MNKHHWEESKSNSKSFVIPFISLQYVKFRIKKKYDLKFISIRSNFRFFNRDINTSELNYLGLPELSSVAWLELHQIPNHQLSFSMDADANGKGEFLP